MVTSRTPAVNPVYPSTHHAVPGFTLRSVNPGLVLRQLASGVYNRPLSVITHKKPITLVSYEPTMVEIYGKSDHDGVYTRTVRSGRDKVYATSGHQHLEVVHRTGQPVLGGRCDLCKEDYTTARVGYALAHTQEDILMPDGTYQPAYTFWVEGNFCGYKHMLAYIVRPDFAHHDARLRNIQYESNLMVYLQYPEINKVWPANDPTLKLSEGGSLTEAQYNDHRFVYRATPFLTLVPVKRSFVREECERGITAADVARGVNSSNNPQVTALGVPLHRSSPAGQGSGSSTQTEMVGFKHGPNMTTSGQGGYTGNPGNNSPVNQTTPPRGQPSYSNYFSSPSSHANSNLSPSFSRQTIPVHTEPSRQASWSANPTNVPSGGMAQLPGGVMGNGGPGAPSLASQFGQYASQTQRP